MQVAAWMTPEEEARAVRRAAARARCEVRTMRVEDTLAGPRAVGHVVCPDGWAAAWLLLGLCAEDAKTAGARDLALSFRAQAPSDVAFATLVHRFVTEEVAFVREQGEVFAGPSYTLVARGGDCDDHVRLTYALLAAGGLPVRLAFLHRPGQGPAHVVAQVMIAGAWRWAETTVPASLGEHPLDAARRVGVIKSRSDLASEVRIMNEKDLPPVPPGFDAKNPPAKVADDMQALVRLGYLGAVLSLGAADAPDFRHSVARFQRDHGLVTDGLIGPKTRHALRLALDRLGPSSDGWVYMGDPTTAPIVTGRTSYLSDAFFSNVAAMARDFRAQGAKVSGEDFLAIWLSESGVNPARKGNPPFDNEHGGKSFGGLNMLSEQGRINLGAPAALSDYVALSDVEQLVFVRKFYESNVRAFCGGSFACLTDVGSLYLMNFLPAYMKHASDPSFVLASAAGPNGAGDQSAEIYRSNAGIDKAKKGAILVSDLPPFALGATRSDPGKWAELTARIRSAGEPPMNPPSEPGSAGVVVAGAVVLGVIGAIWHWYT